MRSVAKGSRGHTPRLRRSAAGRGSTALKVAVAICGVLALVGGAWFLSRPEPMPAAAARVAEQDVATATVRPARVQMPNLIGMELQAARTIVSAAGMGSVVRAEDPSASRGVDVVVDQSPAAGELIEATVTVTLVVRKGVDPVGTQVSGSAARKSKKKRVFVVCIDPGHQAHSDSSPEPIGPKSTMVRPQVTGGATGVKTHIPEYELNLQIATNLKKRLEAHGVKVVMTRVTNDVNLANSERAEIANKARADLLVRIHCDGSPDPDTCGISTLYPVSNKWTRSFAADSRRAARLVQGATVQSTSAIDRGTTPRGDLSGFNWSRVPAVLVECGFVSNPVEDRLLASPHYQDKVASGIAEGVMQYLRGRTQ